MIVINFPHNPTGSYLSLAQLEEIVAIARKHDIVIYSDEMFHKLVSRGIEELPPICNIYEKGISLRGTSKSFGLAGLRTGWLVCQNKEFLNKVVAFKDYLSICNSAPNEILSIIALNNINQLLQPNIKKNKKNISYFQEFVKEQDVIAFFILPKAVSTSFVKLNIEGSSIEFSKKLLKETGIMTVPAETFEYEGKYIRVGFGRENFPKVLNVFADYIKKYSGLIR